MNNIMQSFKPTDQRRIEAIARELSHYGLGILLPHAHDSNGSIRSLSHDMIICENGLKVSFVPRASAQSDAVAVGWRWINGTLTICANCCSDQP